MVSMLQASVSGAGRVRPARGNPIILREWKRFASAPPAGTIRRDAAPGTGSFTRRRVDGRNGSTNWRYYAEHFNTVEVNSTFYGQPQAEVTRGWAESHAARFRVLGQAVPEVHAPAHVPRARRTDVEGCRSGCADHHGAGPGRRPPISTSSSAASNRSRPQGKLGALLAQFPASFKATTETRDALARLLRAFEGYQVAVELRHRTWSDDVTER